MAAAASTLGEHFSEELTCSICLELFTSPKVLPCQHTFCQDCLQDHAGKKKHLKCPNCRQQVELSSQGVAGLQDNHLVTSLCERLQNQATLSGETREERQSGNRCSFHPSEEAKLLCKQCNVPVCSECLDEMHSDHATLSLKKASLEREALIAEGKNILESYHSFILSLKEKEKSLNEQKQQTEKGINQTYKQMVQKLTENREYLLSRVDKKHRKNKEVLQKERDRLLAGKNELSTVCGRAEKERQKGAFSERTVLIEVVGKHREKAAAPTPVQTQPAVFQPTDDPAPELGDVTVPVVAETRHGVHHQAETVLILHGEGRETGTIHDSCVKLKLVSVSNEGEIFLADCVNQKIQVFTLQGTFVRQFPTVVSGEEKMRPNDVATDGEGNLWVVGGTYSADYAVQYNKQGRMLRKIDLQWVHRNRGIAVDTRRNHILITQATGDGDNEHGEVLVFRPDGTLVRTAGRSWMGWFKSLFWKQRIQMKHPRYITVDEEGTIFVTDCGNDCVFVYNEDGQFLFQFGGLGSGKGQLYCPAGICTDRAGYIVVADAGNNRVEMFDKTGSFLKHITTDVETPWGVAMATQGQLVVTNCDYSSNAIIQVL